MDRIFIIIAQSINMAALVDWGTGYYIVRRFNSTRRDENCRGARRLHKQMEKSF